MPVPFVGWPSAFCLSDWGCHFCAAQRPRLGGKDNGWCAPAGVASPLSTLASTHCRALDKSLSSEWMNPWGGLRKEKGNTATEWWNEIDLVRSSGDFVRRDGLREFLWSSRLLEIPKRRETQMERSFGLVQRTFAHLTVQSFWKIGSFDSDSSFCSSLFQRLFSHIYKHHEDWALACLIHWVF